MARIGGPKQDFLKLDVNQVRFNAFLRAVTRITDDLRIPFNSIAGHFYRGQKRIFHLKGPGGYEDLAESTKLQKQKKFGFIYPILFRTGKLAASLTSRSGQGNVLSIGKKHLIMGTSISYGIYHQSDKPRTKIPKRKFIFIEGKGKSFPKGREFQGRAEAWAGIINDYLGQIFERQGWTRGF